MRTAIACLALLLLCCPLSRAQEDVAARSRAAALRNQNLDLQIPHGGYVAHTLEDLVEASQVIVRGRWGAVLEQGTDFGYGVTREDVMARTGATEANIHMYGLPYMKHEIRIDAVLKGEGLPAGATALAITAMESPEAIDVFTWLREFREGEHLFFLDTVVEDDVYRIRGQMFDMKLVDGAYLYRAEEDYVSVLGSEDAQAFLGRIEAIIDE